MAPKGLKRQSSAAASPKKRGKVAPMHAGIIATLQGAENLNEQCREMLVGMAAPCLNTFKSERIQLQRTGVTMIEETLNDHQKKLVAAVAVAKRALADLEGSKTSLLQTLDGAKATLEEKRANFLASHTAREDAKAAVQAAETALADVHTAQKKGDANHAALEKQKAAIDAAYQQHFKAPMDANEGPHQAELKPFIKNLGLEESLTSALPSSCLKTKDQRGGFDELVLGELGKALVAKIEGLAHGIAEEAAGVIERKAGVTSAEAVLEAKKAAEKTAEACLEAAANVQHEADWHCALSSQDWSTFQPRVQEATDEHHLRDTMRIDFEEGALKEFASLRDKEAPPPVDEAEAAPLGA